MFLKWLVSLLAVQSSLGIHPVAALKITIKRTASQAIPLTTDASTHSASVSNGLQFMGGDFHLNAPATVGQFTGPSLSRREDVGDEPGDQVSDLPGTIEGQGETPRPTDESGTTGPDISPYNPPTNPPPSGPTIIMVDSTSSIKTLLDSITKEDRLTEKMANDFIFSAGIQATVPPLSEAKRILKGTPDAISPTRGLVAGLASAPMTFSGIRNALPADINELAGIAASEKTLKAIGLDMKAWELVDIGNRAANALHGASNTAIMTVDERAQACILGASLAGALGQKSAAKLLEKGGVEASKSYADGLKDWIKKANAAAKASSELIAATGTAATVLGPLLYIIFGILNRKGSTTVTVSATAGASTESTATEQFISPSLQTTTSVEETETVDARAPQQQK